MTTSANTTAPQTPNSPATVSPRLIRELPTAVIVTNLVVAAIGAIVIFAAGRSDWWGPFGVAAAVASINAVVSLIIISRSAGKPADFVVTMVMLLAGVRIGVSMIGLIASVKLLQTHPEATAGLICGYYAATLVVESMLVRRALTGEPASANSTLRGNQG